MSAADQSGRYRSPFRYPGGKGKIVNFIKLLMLENGMVGHDYVEPYAGGASVALSLLFEDYADEIHINDINPGVHAFWDAALHSTSELCELINRTPVTMNEWHNQRAVLTAENPDPLQLALATFFLNRTNRSASSVVASSAARTRPGLGRSTLATTRPNSSNGSARSAARAAVSTSPRSTAPVSRALDPTRRAPDVSLSRPAVLREGRGPLRQLLLPRRPQRIATVVDHLAYPWLVSYDAALEILDLYRHHRLLRYGLSYSANRRGRALSHGVRLGTLIPRFPPAGIPPTSCWRRVQQQTGLRASRSLRAMDDGDGPSRRRGEGFRVRKIGNPREH